MINTLLSFVKADRLGLWHAHLSAFEDMLALLAAHDHTTTCDVEQYTFNS